MTNPGTQAAWTSVQNKSRLCLLVNEKKLGDSVQRSRSLSMRLRDLFIRVGQVAIVNSERKISLG